MNRGIALAFVGLALAVACGPQADGGSGGDDGGAGPLDAGMPLEDDGAEPDAGGPDVGVPNPCGPGLALCGDECVDLQTSSDHCGECGNVCRNEFSIGPCEAGVCPPNYECGGEKADYRDCSEVCQAAGQECADEGACSGAYELYYDGSQGLSACGAGLGGGRHPEGSCSDPIDWSLPGGLMLTEPVAVACCCTQG